MPRIPDYQQQVQTTVGPQLAQSTQAPIEAFGGGQALGGMEAATKLAGQAAEDFTDIKKQADLAKVMQANDQTIQAKNRALYDPTTGAMNLKGQSAFGATEAFGSKFKNDTDQIAAGLDNDDQRAMYERLRLKEGQELQSQLEKHTLAQAQDFQKEQYASSIKTVMDDTTFNYNVPGKIDQSVAQVRAMAMHQADLDGITDPAMREQRAKDAQSQVYSGVLERMINTSDPNVHGYYMGVAGQLTAADRQKIEPSLKASQVADASAKKADELIRQSPDLTSQLQTARETMEPGELRDKTIQRLKEYSADNKTAIEADSNARYSALSQIVEKSNGWAQLPITELQKMSSDDRAKLEARARQLKEGVTAERASRAYYKYMNLAAEDPGAFKRLNLDTIIGQVTPDERAKFIGMQDDLKSGKANRALDQHRSAKEIGDEGARMLGFDWKSPINSTQKTEFNDAYMRAIDDASVEKGRPLNDEEMTGIRDKMITKVVTDKGWFYNTYTPAFQVSPQAKADGGMPPIYRVGDIAPTLQRQVREAMARNGIKETDDAMVYWANQLMNKKPVYKNGNR